MRRYAALLCCACLPALAATEISGRITHTEYGGEAFGRSGSILRLSLTTDAGELVVVNVVDAVTRVVERGELAPVEALRVSRRARATLPDDCAALGNRCVAIEVAVIGGGVRTLEAQLVQDDGAPDAGARTQVEPTLDDPGMRSLGQSHEFGRDVADSAPGKVKRSFVKGELTNLGSDKLVVADSRFGLRMGYARLDGKNYLALQPELDLHFGDTVGLGLGVPLNVAGYPNGFYDTGKITLRKHDYDRPSDFARVLRFFTVGRKEDQFYLNVSQLVAASIGHGAIVRRYSGNTDQNVTRVGAQLDAYGKYGGFEAFVGDVVQPQHFLAGLAFLKPLGFLSGDLGSTLGQTSLGVSTAADLAAPYTLSRGANTYPDVGDDGEPTVLETRRAQLVGLDLETKVFKSEGSDIKLFGDYSRLLDVSTTSGAGGQGGGGFTLGTLGRFNAGDVKVHAFRLVLEGRYFDGNYLPGYFDTFYEVQKYQFITGRADTAYEPKLRTILGRDPAHKRAGYYLEAAYQYNGGLALSAALEDSFHVAGPEDICAACAPAQKRVGARNLTLHLEYPAYSWLQFFGSYFRRSFEGPLVNTQSVLGDDNTLLYAALRVHVLPILFLNARIFRSWQADPVLGEMKNVYGGDLDLEIGYEFDRSRHARR